MIGMTLFWVKCRFFLVLNINMYLNFLKNKFSEWDHTINLNENYVNFKQKSTELGWGWVFSSWARSAPCPLLECLHIVSDSGTDFQLPTTVHPACQQVMAQGVGSLPSMWESRMEFLAPGFSLWGAQVMAERWSLSIPTPQPQPHPHVCFLKTKIKPLTDTRFHIKK